MAKIMSSESALRLNEKHVSVFMIYLLSYTIFMDVYFKHLFTFFGYSMYENIARKYWFFFIFSVTMWRSCFIFLKILLYVCFVILLRKCMLRNTVWLEFLFHFKFFDPILFRHVTQNSQKCLQTTSWPKNLSPSHFLLFLLQFSLQEISILQTMSKGNKMGKNSVTFAPYSHSQLN